MAIYTVELDGETFDVEGPDNASEADIEAFVRQNKQTAQQPIEPTPKSEESKTKQLVRKVADYLPTIGGIAVPTVGAISTGGLSLPATAGLVGVGSAGGTAAKQLILRALGDQEGVPQTSAEAAKEIGITGVKDAALTYLGGKALQGIGKAAKIALAPSLTKSGAAISEAEIAAGARLPRGVEKLSKVARSPEKARVEIDKIGETLGRFVERGKQPTGRFLTRQKDRLDLILNKFSKSNAAKDQLGQDAYVKAATIKKQLMTELNKQIPERVKPAAQYAAGKTREKVLKGVVTAAKKALIPGSILAGLAGMK